MKRLALFICTLLCANVLMAQTRFWVGNLQYEVTSTNPAEVMVYDAKPLITTANIPATVSYNGTTYSVTAIGSGAFSHGDLTSVTIPNSVTSIGNSAFSGCSSLSSITIPNSVTSIGNSVFYDCDGLTSITIPNSVTSIGKNAFKECSSLTSVTIGNSVTSIGDYAFYLCSSLSSITIPNSVTSIGEEAFRGCSDLTYIILGESVDSIGKKAFASSSFLQKITCLATNPPTLFSNSFPNSNMATLTVPCGSLDAYTVSTSFWNILFNGRIEEDCTSLEDVEDTELSFYPNPTDSKITFSSTIESIEVIDLTGRCVLTFSNAREINIESLPAGVYYLRLTNNDKAIMQKVIKQ